MNPWDHVLSVDKVILGAGTGTYPDATLFLNGRHQTPVTIVLSFVMESSVYPSPSADEVMAAIIWINYANGADIEQDIVATTQNDYSLYYNPSNRQSAKSRATASLSTGIGRREEQSEQSEQERSELSSSAINCYITSGAWTTPKDFPLSFRLKAQRSDESWFEQTFKDNDIGAPAAVIVFHLIAPQKYGMPDSTTLPPITLLQVFITNANFKSDSGKDRSNLATSCQFLSIADSFFYAKNWTLERPSLDQNGLIYIYRNYESTEYNTLYNTYLSSMSLLFQKSDQQIEKDQRNFCSTPPPYTTICGIATTSFLLPANSLAFQNTHVEFHKYGDDTEDYYPSVTLDLFDQFGNQATVKVQSNGAVNINSVT